MLDTRRTAHRKISRCRCNRIILPAKPARPREFSRPFNCGRTRNGPAVLCGCNCCEQMFPFTIFLAAFSFRIYIYIYTTSPFLSFFRFLALSFLSLSFLLLLLFLLSFLFFPPFFSLFGNRLSMVVGMKTWMGSKGGEHAFNFRINSRSPAALILLPETGGSVARIRRGKRHANFYAMIPLKREETR